MIAIHLQMTNGIINIFDILVLAFATYRLSLLFTLENGPFDMFLALRRFVGLQELEEEVYIIKSNIFSEVLACFYCTSVWIAILSFVIYVYVPKSIMFFIPLSIAGLTILVYELRRE